MSRRSLLLGFGLLVVLASLGCGASTEMTEPDASSDPGPGLFDGTWNGSATVTLTPINPPGPVQTNTSSLVFVFAAATPGTTYGMRVQLGGGSGSDWCVLGAMRNGTTATIPAGQTCRPGTSSDTPTITVISGTATVTGGNSLVVDLTIQESGTVSGSTVTLRAQIHFSSVRA